MKENLLKEEMRFGYTKLNAFEKHLSLYEKNGLRFINIENGKIIFEKSDKRKIRYSAVVFTAFDMKKEFVDACQAKGWEFVTDYNDKLYIFRTQNPDAPEIITNEKEYFKSLAEKTFFQTGFFKNLLWALFFTLTTIVFGKPYPGLTATNIEACAIIIFIAFSALQTIARLIHFAILYAKSKPLYDQNPIMLFPDPDSVKKLQSWDILNIIQFAFMLSTVVFLGVGFCDITLHCRIIAVFIIINLFDFIQNKDRKHSLKKAFVTTAVAGIFIVAGTFYLTQWADTEYNNLHSGLNYGDIPISVSDLMETGADCTDKTLSVKSTRLGSHYSFSSGYKEGEDTSYYIHYDVLVSDHLWVTENYIESLQKRYKKDEKELIKADEAFGWDSVYYEVTDGKIGPHGYAKKNNTVIMLDFYDLPDGTDFFEIAYTALN